MTKPATVALALGSGGARGYAHVGALQVLREAGIEVVGIAGSSMGALIGGLYAAGHLDEYMDWARTLSRFDVLRLMDASISAPGMIRAEKVFAKVQQILGDDVLIEDLPIPFTAVATDLLARKEVWFQEGPLAVALRASVAIPTVITPLVLNGRLLVDGGLLDPVPLAPIAAVRADATLAITLNGESRVVDESRSPSPAAPSQESAAARPMEEWGERFRRAATRLLDIDAVRALTSRFGRDDGDGGGNDGAGGGNGAGGGDGDAAGGDGDGPEPDQVPALGRFDVMNLSIEAMQNLLTRYRMAGNAPDVLVSVPKDACRSLEFHRAAELVELGRTLTIEAIRNAGWLDDH